MEYKILVVEDDAILRLGLKTLLENKYIVKGVRNSEEAIEIIEEENFHLILTDIMMDGGNVHNLLKYLKENDISIDTFVITSLDDEKEMIKLYKMEILDYIIKPVNFEILEMKIANHFKNKYTKHKSEGIVLNKKEITITIRNKKYRLSEKEYNLLNLLITFPNQIFSKYDLLNEIWFGNMNMSEKVVEVTISNLRNKLGKDKEIIKTQRGQGYYYEK